MSTRDAVRNVDRAMSQATRVKAATSGKAKKNTGQPKRCPAPNGGGRRRGVAKSGQMMAVKFDDPKLTLLLFAHLDRASLVSLSAVNRLAD